MANTVETVWRLILDESAADESKEQIEELYKTTGKFGEELAKIARSKKLEDLAKSWGKTAIATGRTAESAEALNDQLKKIGATDDEIKSLAKMFTEVGREADKAGEKIRKAGDASGGIDNTVGELGGKVGGAAGKLRGVGGLFGGGEGLGIVNDIGDAIEGVQELGGTLAELGPAGALAGVAIVALGLVLSDFAAGAQKTADEINAAIDGMRSVADEIAGGATSDDIQESIEQLQFRRQLEKDILAESTQSYADFVQGIRDAFGIFAPLIEGIVKVIDPREEALKSQIEESNKLIGESEAKERAYNKALDQGLTSKADAAKAEEDRQKSAEKSAREAEAAQKEQQRAQEKSNADAQRLADQQIAKEQQAAEKRYQAAQKYSDSLIDIAKKSADDAKKALSNLRMTLADNREAFLQDMSDMSADFRFSEQEEAIKRGEEEVQDAINQTRKLEQIRDDAYKNEEDALRQRDFLGASKIREQANEQIEEENQAFKDAQEDKMRAMQAEDAAQLRQLDKARRDRLQALDRANADAKQAYQRDLINQREARKIAERDAAMARNRELRGASDAARALLGIKTQQSQAELQIAANTLSQLKGMGNTTNNNNKTVNGGINFSMGGAGSMSATQIQSTVLQVLGSVGLA